MRKIKLFDRHTALDAVSPRACRESSYRGTGPHKNVQHFCGWFHAESGGFNCDAGIPLFSGMTAKICGMMVVIAALFATPSFAEPTELDKKTVASKAYVDTKQDIIETGLVTFHELEEDIDYTVPALVSYGTGTNNADGVLGNKIGILGINQAAGGLYSYEFLDDLWDDEESGYLDNFVPTVRAISVQLNSIWNSMPYWHALSWDNNLYWTPIVRYSATFGNDGNWPGTSTNLINGEFLANSLALKQYKIPSSGSNGGMVVVNNGEIGITSRAGSTLNDALPAGSLQSYLNPYVKGTGLVTKTAIDGVVGERKIFEATDIANYHANGLNQYQQATQDISIPTVGAMMTAITNGANAALPAGTAGNVVTYTGTAGTVSSRGVYNNPSSVYFDNPNINDNELITVNAAGAIVDYVDARTPEITCAGVEPGTNECWLWTIPTYTTATRPLPRGDGNLDVWVTGYTSRVSCVNAIRNNTSFTGLSEAVNAADNAPTRVATGLSSTAASNLVSTLVSGGCTAETRNP